MFEVDNIRWVDIGNGFFEITYTIQLKSGPADITVNVTAEELKEVLKRKRELGEV